MEETNRQKKFSKLIQIELSHILQFDVKFPGVMVTISVVRSTKDLSLCRVYIMAFPPVERKNAVMYLNKEQSQIRKFLGNKIRHQVRTIPALEFFEDDTLDYAEKMDALFSKIKSEEKE